MCCELFPRIGFQITAIRYIGAHPGDLFGSDGTPSHTPGTQPVRQHMAYVSFRTASSIWLGQGFMGTELSIQKKYAVRGAFGVLGRRALSFHRH